MSARETATMIGGPWAGVKISLRAGLAEIEALQTSRDFPVTEYTAHLMPPQPRMMRGTYLRILCVNPPVFMWQGWE